MVEAYDSDPAKIGQSVAGKPVRDVAELYSGVGVHCPVLAMLTVPASAAQGVCDLLVEAGVKGILNFAPVQLKAPESVTVRNIDVAASLAILASLL